MNSLEHTLHNVKALMSKSGVFDGPVKLSPED